MMTFRERFDRWFCRAGWHEWGEYKWSTDTDRICQRCGETQVLRLVDFGRSRCWVRKPNPPVEAKD